MSAICCPKCNHTFVPVNPSAASIKRPKAGTLTGQVWDICDELVTQKGQATRKEALAVGLARGLVHATITTQYQAWKSAQAAQAAAAAKAAEAAAAEASDESQVQAS